MRMALFLPSNCDFIALMDIDTGLRRFATYLEALKCPPVGVGVDGRTIDHCDSVRQVLQVDDVGIPRRADVIVADKQLRVVDVEDDTVYTGAQRYGLTGSLATDDEVIQAILAGTGSPTTFVADEGGHLAGVNDGIAIFQLDDHCHVVRIEA